jgi:putative aminopeptidase FrvX
MAKGTKNQSKLSISKPALAFLKEYINTPSPTGFESGGQKLWMNYIKPHVDEVFTDPYGTVVGVSRL